MKEKLLHTPDGVRDIYNIECKRKRALKDRLHDVLSLYGYQDIETPVFEFFDIFNSDTGTVSSQSMFKFFDRENRTLVLRPDMTPSIARSVAKYYADVEQPLRLSYMGDTFINHPGLQGKLAQKTELGAEHINDDSYEADAEAIAMMADCFRAAGVENFRIDVGIAEFYKGLMDALDISETDKTTIHDYILNRNSLGLELFLEDLAIDNSSRQILLEYADLYGDDQMLLHTLEMTDNPRCRSAINRLLSVYEVLKMYGCEDVVSFDLGMINSLDYYTGIIFNGYTYGSGDAVAKGGRYDRLLSQFGKNAPAIGFTIIIDDMLAAISRQNLALDISAYEHCALLYRTSEKAEAIKAAKAMRKEGIRTELLPVAENICTQNMMTHAIELGAKDVYELHDGRVVKVFSNQ